MMTIKQILLVTAATCAGMIVAPPHAWATVYSWTGEQNDDFSNPNNWTPFGVPNDSSDTAFFNRLGSHSIDFGGSDATSGSMTFRHGTWNFDMLGTYELSPPPSSPAVLIGTAANRFAALNLEGGVVNASLDGGILTANEQLVLGNIATSTGVLSLNGNAVWNSANQVIVGAAGSGTLNILGGSEVSNVSGRIGRDPGGTGVVTVSGVSDSGNPSLWENSALLVGVDGSGSLMIQGGGKVSNFHGQIAVNSGSIGTVVVSGTDVLGGASVWDNMANVIVGFAGAGSLAVESGGKVLVSDHATIGSEHTGTVTVSGADGLGKPSLIAISGFMILGDEGSGSLRVDGGGRVSNGSHGLIGAKPSGIGTATVSGVGSKWTNSANLYVGGDSSGPAGSGTLIAEDRGEVVVTDLLKVYSTGTVSLSGGQINAPILDLDGGTLSGWGSVQGNVTGGSTITASGRALLIGDVESTNALDFKGTIHVQDSASLVVLGVGEAKLGPQTELTNGLLIARHGVDLDTGDVIAGYGIIIGAITGSGRADIATSPVGTVHFAGDLDVKGNTAEIHSIGLAELSGAVTIAGGMIVAPNGYYLGKGGSLTGFGTLTGFDLLAEAGTTITVDGGDFTLGDPNSFGGFRTDGRIHVNNRTITLQSAGFASLGALTTLNGGTLIARNGIALGVGDNLQGTGTVDARIFAQGGTVIDANGDLMLGDSTSPVGFISDGELRVNQHTVTLNDNNAAVLGSLTTIGDDGRPGTIAAANGAVVDFGRNITGFGAMDTPNDPLRPTIVNGSILGNSSAEPITLSGYIKGVGTLDNVIVTGTDAPGLSPAAVTRGTVTYRGVLEIEIAGTEAGREYDQLDHALGAGVADLGGSLELRPLSSYSEPTAPGDFDLFALITAADVVGTFDEVKYDNVLLEATLTSATMVRSHQGDGLFRILQYDGDSVNFINYQALPGDANGDFAVNELDFDIWNTYRFTNSTDWLTADFNGDGVTGVSDFNLWNENRGSRVAVRSVSEPTTAMLILLGSVAFWRSARRKVI